MELGWTRPIWPSCWRHPKRCSVALTVALHLPLPTTCRRLWHCCGWWHQRKFVVLPQVQTIPNHKCWRVIWKIWKPKLCDVPSGTNSAHTSPIFETNPRGSSFAAVNVGLWNFPVGLWNFPVGLWNFPVELWNLDCETSRTDCETSIVKLESRIVKLENRIVKL